MDVTSTCTVRIRAGREGVSEQRGLNTVSEHRMNVGLISLEDVQPL